MTLAWAQRREEWLTRRPFSVARSRGLQAPHHIPPSYHPLRSVAHRVAASGTSNTPIPLRGQSAPNVRSPRLLTLFSRRWTTGTMYFKMTVHHNGYALSRRTPWQPSPIR